MQEQQLREKAQLEQLKKLEKGQARALAQAQAQAQVQVAVAQVQVTAVAAGCTGFWPAVSEGQAAGVAAIGHIY
jgi:hypothetical protein